MRKRSTKVKPAPPGRRPLLAVSAVTPVAANGHPLAIALGASLVLHAVLLSLHFQFPDAARAFKDNALDIVLVNSKSARKPVHAQALAQANLDGGGNSEKNHRARTPLPPAVKQQSGNELDQAQKRVKDLEALQESLLALARSGAAAAARSEKEAPANPAPTPSGRDLAHRALEMARLEGEIARDTEEYNKRPRVKNLGTRTEEYRFAQYMDDWRQKIERIGTLNYPEAAKGKLYGNLQLSVRIKSDGQIDRVEINRSSGHKILDDAARRIVRMAAPFAPFPGDIRRDTDILEITRTWNFTSSNQLQTKAP